jgi:hypothetical protein
MEPALQLLVEHGFLVPQTPATQDGKPGRPAGLCYDINPHLYTPNPYAQNTQNTQKGDTGRDSEGYEHSNPYPQNSQNPSKRGTGEILSIFENFEDSSLDAHNRRKEDAGGGFEDFEYFERQKTALNGAHNATMGDGKQSVDDVDEVVI